MPSPARYTSRMTEALSYHREFELSDETATLALGSQVAGEAQVPQVIFLRGDLGAGKTTFSRGFLRGRGHDGSVKSPTYTLVEPYESVPGGPVFHLDLYRLGDAQELVYLPSLSIDTTDILVATLSDSGIFTAPLNLVKP